MTLALLVCQAEQMVEKGDDALHSEAPRKAYAFDEFGGRSAGEIRKLLTMGKSSDPSAAHEREKEKARAGMAKVRARRANVGAHSNPLGERAAGIAPDAEGQPIVPASEHTPEALTTVQQVAHLLANDDRTLLVYWPDQRAHRRAYISTYGVAERFSSTSFEIF